MSQLPPPISHEVHITAINARTLSRVLEVEFADGKSFSLPFELMRVYSPSAEVRGHGEGQEVLQIGKRNVSVTGIEPVGNYGIKPLFTDDHSTGIYTWAYLYWLGMHQDALWADYLARLQTSGYPEESGRDALPVPKTHGKCH
jgi:DUF971 family protein